MTTLRLTRSGVNVAGRVRVRGDVVHVEDDTAALLCSTGQAEPVALVPDVEPIEPRGREAATPRAAGRRRAGTLETR